MRKRITAVLLSLVLLLMMIPVLPASAEEVTEEIIYKEGDKVWVAGYGNKPKFALEKEWFYWDMTGESRQGECPYVEHTHSKACRDKNWNRICGFTYEHEHDPFCIIDAVEYEWVVKLDLEKLPPSENPIITIHSVGPEGEPLAGCGYILLYEKIKTDSKGEPLVENGKYVIETILMGRTTADETGTALLGFEELNLDTEEKTVRLLLGQELSRDLQNVYKPLLNRWYVTILRNDVGGCTIQSVTRAPAVTVAPDAPDPEATQPEGSAPTEPANGGTAPENGQFVDEYDKVNNTLTVVNEYLRGSIKIDVQFDGFEGPVPADVMATVTIPELGDQGVLEIRPDENGFYLVQASLDELLMGTYTLNVSEPVEVEGYTAEGVTVQLYCPVDADPVPETAVTLDKYSQNARFVITYHYVADVPPTDPSEATTPSEGPADPDGPTNPSDPTDPSDPTNPVKPGSPAVNTSNTVVIKVVDDLERPLSGTEVGLFDGKTQIAKYYGTYENIYVLDDLAKYAKTGQSVSYTLKQTRAPAGYRLSGDSYTVKISNRNGTTEVDVKKNAGAMQSIFKGTGVEVGPDGKQIITLCNTRKTTQMEIACNVAVNFDEASWFDEELIAQYKQRQYEYTLKWENAEGEEKTETVKLAHGERVPLKAEIPYGTYYEVTVTDEDGSYLTEFAGNCRGRVDAAQLKENILVEATQVYTVELGDSVALDLVKVDAEDKRPLAGVQFSLQTENGMELQAYTSGENGELSIREVLHKPGSYLLVETRTLEGYMLLAEPAKIDVTAAYVLDTSGEGPVLIQNLAATISHSAVVAESDGSYWIENERMPVAEEPVEENDGLGLGTIIGIAAAIAAGVGIAAFVLLRKRRKMG